MLMNGRNQHIVKQLAPSLKKKFFKKYIKIKINEYIGSLLNFRGSLNSSRIEQKFYLCIFPGQEAIVWDFSGHPVNLPSNTGLGPWSGN